MATVEAICHPVEARERLSGGGKVRIVQAANSGGYDRCGLG